MVISDHRRLNLLHAEALCDAGYAVYTAVTCTDVPRLLDQFRVTSVDTVVFASLVHGWHPREAEERPVTVPDETDGDWQVRNIRQFLDTVRGRQRTQPKVLVAVELMGYSFYDVTAEALAVAGIDYQAYPASDPSATVDFVG